jgi:hypothetical protein
MKKSFDSNVKVGQGNGCFIVDFQGGYLVNSHKPKAFGSYIYRSFDPSKTRLLLY